MAVEINGTRSNGGAHGGIGSSNGGHANGAMQLDVADESLAGKFKTVRDEGCVRSRGDASMVYVAVTWQSEWTAHTHTHMVACAETECCLPLATRTHAHTERSAPGVHVSAECDG